MRKLSVLIGICFSIHFFAGSGTLPVNSVIGDNSFIVTFGHSPVPGTDEVLRIQTHLKFVEKILEEKDVSGLSDIQQQRRIEVIAHLHQYWTAGIFPSNFDFPMERRPCFIDKNGKILGKHKGYPFYTIGQRKGLDIALGRPAFVTQIIPETNTVMLGEESDLNKKEMKVAKMNWMKHDGITDGMEAVTKIRYKDKGSLSNLYNGNGGIHVNFYEDAKGVAPGQSAVFYDGEDVIGGGIIQRAVDFFSNR